MRSGIIAHIMNTMQTTNLPALLHRITRWIVPLAAILVMAAWLLISPPGLLGKADAVGYAVCHRIDARSFHIGERQLPLCARCSGTFTAAGVGLVLQAVLSRRRSGFPARKVILVLGLFAVAFGLDGGNSYLYLIKEVSAGQLEQIPNLYTPQQSLRLLTGSGMGLGMAAAIFPVFNQTIWKNFDPRPALAGWRELGILVGAMLVIDLGILSENPIVLYPIAFISVAGVVSLLTLVFAMLWVMAMRQDNTFETLQQTWLPMLAGFTLAMLMIMGIDLLRLNLTGTWSAFPIG